MLPNIEKIIQELNRGKNTSTIRFFCRKKNEKFQSKAIKFGLSENTIEFFKYLQSDICATLL